MPKKKIDIKKDFLPTLRDSPSRKIVQSKIIFKKIIKMFGIGGGEIVFILMVVLMLFGSDKVPEIARTLGKMMAQLKNATNDIKSEIQKGVNNITDESALKDISSEINKAKEGFLGDSTSTITKVKEDFENLTGPIKRQL